MPQWLPNWVFFFFLLTGCKLSAAAVPCVLLTAFQPSFIICGLSTAKSRSCQTLSNQQRHDRKKKNSDKKEEKRSDPSPLCRGPAVDPQKIQRSKVTFPIFTDRFILHRHGLRHCSPAPDPHQNTSSLPTLARFLHKRPSARVPDLLAGKLRKKNSANLQRIIISTPTGSTRKQNPQWQTVRTQNVSQHQMLKRINQH